MKYINPFIFAGLAAFSLNSSAASELPNFEIALGAGVAKDEPAFNIDLTVNIPVNQRIAWQVNLDSDYIFDDPTFEDYSTSEFNTLGFYRKDNWRLGAGLGYIQKKSRDDSFSKESKFVGHLLAAYHWEDLTLDWQYSGYNNKFERAVTMEAGVLWYPDIQQRFGVYVEEQERGTGWRLEALTQPEKYNQQVAFGVIMRNGNGPGFPYIGMEMRYYFDRSITIKNRDRNFH